jgi:predicted nucleotidyltransferase
MLNDIVLEPDTLRAFCQRWLIDELAFFGSVLRADFRPDSDIDILVSFAEDAPWSLLDEIRMIDELEDILGRKVDLVSRQAVEKSHNWLRRQNILGSAQVVYAAR